MNRPRETFAFVWALLIGPTFACAELASGGAFTLDSSLFTATQQSAAGGSFQLTGSIGEGFSHVAGENQSVKYPRKRVFDGFLAPLKTDPSLSSTLVLNNIAITIPANALTKAYESEVELDPLDMPIVIDPTLLQQAGQELTQQIGLQANAPLSIVEIHFLLADDSLFDDQMSRSSQYQMTYPQSGDESVLAVAFDQQSGRWQRLPGDLVVTSGVSASFERASAGIYAIFLQAPSGSLVPYAFPVPWRPNAGDARRYGTAADGITFANMSDVSRVEIYDLAGELVRELTIPSASAQCSWDGKSASGSDVASGVYIWSADVSGSRKFGKLMVIR